MFMQVAEGELNGGIPVRKNLHFNNVFCIFNKWGV